MGEHHGNRWANIAKQLPGRSDNDIKKSLVFCYSTKVPTAWKREINRGCGAASANDGKYSSLTTSSSRLGTTKSLQSTDHSASSTTLSIRTISSTVSRIPCCFTSTSPPPCIPIPSCTYTATASCSIPSTVSCFFSV